VAIAVTVGPVTGGITSGNNSFTLTLTGTTAGRSIVVGVAWQSAFSTVSTVSCSGESNLTLHGSPTQTANLSKLQFASLGNNTGGGDKTITITMSGTASANNQASAYAVELSGTNSASVFDTTNGSTGTSSSPSTSVTTGAEGNAIFALAVADSTGSGDFTAGSGYTLISMTDSSNRQFQGQYDVDAGAAGSKTVDFGLGGSQTWAVLAGSFSIAATSFAITPTTGSLTVAGLAPTVGGSSTITPSVGSISASGIAPTVSTSMSPVLVPVVASLSMTGYEPSTVGTNSGTVEADLLLHTISADGASGPIGAIELLTHTITATGFTGTVGTLEQALPSYELTAGGNHTADISLLGHTLSADGFTGVLGSLDDSLIVHLLSASGVAPDLAVAENDLLYHTSSATGVTGTVGALEATLAAHTLEATAFAGSVGTGANTLLAHTLTTVALASITGEASITLLGHQAESSGIQTLAEAYRTWVLNLRNNALTEYDNFEFNSFALFNGVYLAAGPGGIVELGTQDLDDTAEIDARVRTGSVDYGSSYMKRVPRLYVAGELPGDLHFRSITSEDGERTYILHSNGMAGDQQRRVPIGKGPKSLHWQFELENIAGGDFRLSRVMPYPQELRRRIA
jgi:hypothetical protein